MFSKKSFFASTTFIFGLLGASAAANAQPRCFTLASLQGAYAVVGNYGANVAITLGTRIFDGNGNLTGSFVINEPTPGSTSGERTIVTGTQKGTYAVNCDGTGTITRTLQASNGVTATVMDDFVITSAIPGFYSQLLATSVSDAQRTPAALVPGGIFLTRSYTRLPNRSQ